MTSYEAMHCFFQACMMGDAGSVEKLLSNRILDPNERIRVDSNALLTPLYLSISPGLPEEGSYRILSLLLDYGADPNELCSNHGTPLCVAAQKSDKRFVEKLLEFGAEPNIVGEVGDSPLFASLGAPGDDNAAKLALIKAGADIEFVNPNGYPLLFMAANLGKANFVRLLLELGADINRGYGEGWRLSTPLNIAVSRKRYSVVEVLLEYGALSFDVNGHPCRKFGNSVSLDSIYGTDKRMEGLLISYGACPPTDYDRDTAGNLHHSAQMINDVLGNTHGGMQSSRRLDSNMSYELKPNWDTHGFGWSPDQGYDTRATGSDQNLAVQALSLAVKALRDVATRNGGNCDSVTSSAYQDAFQAVLQVAALLGLGIQQAISQVTSADIENLRFSPIDSQGQAGPTMVMTTGVIPMDSLAPFTALRVVQFFMEHRSGTYVLRFNSYIPTPNDDCSYDDSVFFSEPSKMALGQYVFNGGISLH